MALWRTTVRYACASMESVMCRCQPVHERTSYSSNPVSPLASSKQLSIVHRSPATRTSVDSGVSAGAQVR
jgi:hypothetical protein